MERFTQQFNDYGVIPSKYGEYVKHDDAQREIEDLKVQVQKTRSSLRKIAIAMDIQNEDDGLLEGLILDKLNLNRQKPL